MSARCVKTVSGSKSHGFLSDTVTVISSARSQLKGGEIVLAKIASDPSVKTVVPGNAEEIWHHRQKDLIREVNKRLGKNAKINSHDIFCIKKIYDVLTKRADFAYRSHHLAPPQYSNAFIEWVIDEFRRDNQFFERLRRECRPKAQ